MSPQDLTVEPAVPDCDISIENTTPSGAPPKYRFATAAGAAGLYCKLLEEYGIVASSRARIQGMYDGNAPWNPEELTRLGQGHRCNVNFREMESIIDMNTSAAWSMHTDVDTLIESKVDPKYRKGSDHMVDDWARIVDEEYTRTLLRWPGFYSNLNLALHEYFLMGLGGAVWPDEWDWRSKALKSGNILVPPLAPTDTDKLDIVFIRDQMELGDVYRAIEDRKTAKERGWNVALMKKLLVDIYLGDNGNDGTDDTSTSPWESLQAKYKTGDAGVESREFEKVDIVHVLTREVSGERKISHLIIADNDKWMDEGFLYESRNKYDNIRNAAWLLPYSFGDGYLRSSKGLGHRVMPHCEFSNRFLCMSFDSGVLQSSLIVQPKTGLDAGKMNLVRVGPVTMIPESLAISQTNWNPNLAALISLRGVSKEILHNNTGVYRPRSEGVERETQKTAQQVRSESGREFRFERNQSEHFYTHWQMWHEETFRRMTNKDYVESQLDLPGQKEAREFVDRCETRGVNRNLLLTPGFLEIKVAKAIGMGSPGVKLDLTSQLVAMKGAFSEQARRLVDREWLAARVGYANVDKFAPADVSHDSIVSNAQSFAMLENNSVAMGMQILVGSDQPHVLHAATHMARVEEILQGFQQGQVDPIQAVQELEALLQHIAEHISAASQDVTRQDQVKRLASMMGEYLKAFKQVQKSAEQLLQMQQEQAEAQEQAAAESAEQEMPMNAESRVELARIQKELQVEMAKQESLNGMRAAKTSEQMAINRAKADAQISLANLKTQAELERKRYETEANVALKQMNA